ncbi:MAG: hypothetical protein BWX62_00757 [Bacteroidetes bacterium ADurb.Bin037]|nr:MAG: hypothetical protein BWX62_00757 [Bacteroidetes bacterium ADurb.Bin037]HPW78323.1 hypothetical protein [Bacteroidales bacterium]HQB56298.1 hypothetical protein [Bacteroidales bacterium]
MRKRSIIFLTILSALLVGAAVYGFIQLFKKSGESVIRNDTYRAVPVDAVLVQHFSRFNTLTLNILEPGNYIGRFFRPTEAMSLFLDRLGNFTATDCPELGKAEALCSLHPSAKNTLSALYCLSGANARDPQWWDNFLMTSGIPYKTHSYNGQTIYIMYGEESGNAVFAAYVKDLMMASSSRVVMESSLRHLERGGLLSQDNAFARLVEQTPVSRPTRIFVLHDRIPSLIAAYLGVPMQKYAAFLKTTAEWTVLDGFADEKGLRMDGYAIFPPGGEHFFSVFLEQQPQKLMATEVLPAATLAGLSMGLTDIGSYVNAYVRYLELRNQHRKMPDKERLEWFNLLYPTEISLACVPFRGELQWMSVIHTRYIHQAKIQYALLGRQEEGKVMKNPIPDLLPGIFGPVFNLCPAHYYCYLGSFILFGPEELLEDILKRNKEGTYHSLAAAISQTNAPSNIMNASNLTLFLQPSAGLDNLVPLMDKRYAGRMESWRNFNAQYTLLQFSSLEDRLYGHLLVYGDSLETSPLIPRQRKVRIRGGIRQDTLSREKPPYKVFNHLTRKENELFQTPWPECRLILRDHTGKTLWEKTMEGTIQDRLVQIDFLKNNKLQMLFSIGNRLYLVDRLGRNVSPYPKAFTTSILYGPFVFDPAGNKDYRILLVHQDNILRCYDKRGNILSRWEDFLIPGYLTAPPKYIRTGATGCWVIYGGSQTAFLSETGATLALLTQGDCLDPKTEIEISGPYELRGTTIEGKTITIMLD